MAKTAVPFATLRGLLGKPVDDPAVTKALAKAGKVTIKSDFVIAKDAGFDFSLAQPAGAKRNAKKVLSTLFLFPDGADKHRGYADLPAPLAFTTRSELLAKLPTPARTWKIGKGKVPATTKDPSHDAWVIDGLEVMVSYRDEVVRHITAALPASETNGRSLATHPLHFSTKPADAPADAELIGMALLVGWAADRFGVAAKHASTELGKQLAARAITPRAFLIAGCAKTLTTVDVDPKLEDFLWSYTNRLFTSDERAPAADQAIAKLLGLGRDDERCYSDDFHGTFAKVVDSPFYVPDSWDAVDRIAPVLDARWADFQATSFDAAPDLTLYATAAKLRDARSIEPARAQIAAATADDAPAADLLALLDRPLSDKAVQAVLARAGLPIGKKIDEQANPALGVSYLGSKHEVAGKRVLCVQEVTFFAAKQRSYIRGIGAEVEFRGYPGALPRGLALGASRAQVAAALGAPKQASDDTDYWFPAADRRISATYGKTGKLIRINVGKPAEWLPPPGPPYAPTGVV